MGRLKEKKPAATADGADKEQEPSHTDKASEGNTPEPSETDAPTEGNTPEPSEPLTKRPREAKPSSEEAAPKKPKTTKEAQSCRFYNSF